MSTPPINTNYTIYRVPQAQDILGCTDFQTTETENTDAALGGGGLDVDGDILWHIDGNLGYDVDVVDFSIPGATLTIPFAGIYVFTGGPFLHPNAAPRDVQRQMAIQTLMFNTQNI